MTTATDGCSRGPTARSQALPETPSTPDETSPPEAWLADLAEELTLGPGRPELPFTLLTVITEAESWAANAPASSWSRKQNPASLAADLGAMRDAAGPAVNALLEPDITSLADALTAIVALAGVRGAAAKAARGDNVSAVGVSCAALLTTLAEPACREAVWGDLQDAAAQPEPSATTVRNLVEMLATSLDHAGIEPRSGLREVALTLEQSRWAPPDRILPGFPAPDAGQTERLARASAVVCATAATADCVAWLSFGDARLNGENRVGPVTFYEIDWAVPNTQQADGQDFPHKAEVATLLEMSNELSRIDYTRPQRPYMVLARVDLGHRALLHATDDAAEMVETALGIVQNRTGGVPWRRESFSALLADGVVCRTLSGPHGRQERLEPDHYGQNATADAIDRNAGTLGALLNAGALPASLTQALRLVREAGHVGSRDDQLNSTATIDARSALLLEVSAVEHIAVYANLAEDDLTRLILGSWAIAAWRRDLTDAINGCMQELGGGNALFHAVCHSQFGHWSLSAAYDNRAALLANCREPLRRPDIASLLHSIGDAAATATILDGYTAQGSLLDGRLRRTRNALAHGNPVSASTVASVREISRFKTDAALDSAINAHVQQRPMKEVIDERAAEHESVYDQIAKGVSLRRQWSSDGGDAT